MADIIEVAISDESIRLGQFLKLAGLIDSGSDAKYVIADEQVLVNGALETRRARQLLPGDVITLYGRKARVVRGPETDGADGADGADSVAGPGPTDEGDTDERRDAPEATTAPSPTRKRRRWRR